ncbi:carbohydrate sulfotransferase 4-like [Saccostrea echinata]|uniref:carbohydrate sulfotransferase 4-like n=1 Tax=Saccostrea echinata TaxID=191078 RepID=UPI002A81CCB9|nr:carbohydrate sulfotransferase 4-like [Saccostrea echinata]
MLRSKRFLLPLCTVILVVLLFLEVLLQLPFDRDSHFDLLKPRSFEILDCLDPEVHEENMLSEDDKLDAMGETKIAHASECTYPVFRRRPGKRLVLVLTYLRSGSTLTGDILQQSPQAFYLYEPLKLYKSKIFLDGQACETAVMNCSQFNTSEILEVFGDLFRCRLQEHKRNILGPRKHSLAVMSAIPYCKSRPGFDTCMKMVQAICHHSNAIIVKTIRLSMEFVPRLLLKFPDLRIIHLLRDPRGTMDSRKRGGYLRKIKISSSAKWLCERIQTDVEYSKVLQRRFPNRIITVLYEELAENPIDMSNKLYRNLNLEFSDSFDEWIFNHTSAGNPNDSFYGTIRSNSTLTSQSWRKRLKLRDVRLIEDECKDVLNLLGFRKVNDEEDLKNTDKSLRLRSLYTLE